MKNLFSRTANKSQWAEFLDLSPAQTKMMEDILINSLPKPIPPTMIPAELSWADQQRLQQQYVVQHF